jgi:hypothetical protein
MTLRKASAVQGGVFSLNVFSRSPGGWQLHAHAAHAIR